MKETRVIGSKNPVSSSHHPVLSPAPVIPWDLVRHRDVEEIDLQFARGREPSLAF